ncbi:helix-turn-helix domain-containing protein [Enterococcus innesii]|uniref:helix-turn-helix domain-containing protein n=1 Tax=Enterococcus innesii TaxID=2839759 RepID=UPI002DBB1572|nr:helix-turn-helix domain-containing protein [Enterococcus innesii]MEB5953203.1 helix-turn-helix domain-containing protein [Enterococcus innesii]
MSEKRENIIRVFGLSPFLINKQIEDLNSDFAEFRIEQDVEIVSDNINVTLNIKGKITSDILFSHYIVRSIKFDLFKEMFFEKLISINDYASEHFLSHTTVYTEIKSLKKELSKFDIHITKDFKIKGHERKVREFALVFFDINSIKLKIAESNITNSISKEFESILVERRLIKSGSNYKSIRFELFLEIFITRIKNGHFLKEKEYCILKNNPHELMKHQLIGWLKKYIRGANYNILKFEIESIFYFLIIEGCVDNSKFIDNNFHKIRHLNSLFLKEINSKFCLVKQYEARINTELSKIHFELLNYPIYSTYRYLYTEINYFYEMYPEYFDFCKLYLNKNKKKDILWQGKEFLFYRYVLLLVTNIPLKELLHPIYICLDFSFGNQYNKFIKQNIEKIVNLNIVFQSVPDEKTSLILSDMALYELEDIETVVWLTPPRPIDWSILTEKILSLRKLRT